MMTSPTSELYLAADFSCSGHFSVVGTVREPSLALSVAIRDLQAHCGNVELKAAVVHVLATRVAGRSSILGPHIRRTLGDCLTRRIALEWKIMVPATGTVRALFLVTRLDKAGPSDFYNLALQLAGKPSFECAEAMKVKEAAPPPPRRACSLLRIF